MPKIAKKTIEKEHKKHKALDLNQVIIEALEETKAENILEMDFPSNLGMLFDKFIVCSATSNVHAGTLCENVMKTVKEKLKIIPRHTEGEKNAEWILIDYFHIIVHIFLREKREFYDLENLWNDTAAMIRLSATNK
ncbi:MAG: ribosome silencing factor [Bacteroidales bacterium]|jgi:ribosome-associated protein|nr:ribosome silencing factor [Bacteroidales bacterium]HON20854.1 ribosome silencing factor [Bacteroidales bacterium]HQB20644.1 ribosome silencing factor [Bacteroidales bacterium]